MREEEKKEGMREGGRKGGREGGICHCTVSVAPRPLRSMPEPSSRLQRGREGGREEGKRGERNASVCISSKHHLHPPTLPPSLPPSLTLPSRTRPRCPALDNARGLSAAAS